MGILLVVGAEGKQRLRGIISMPRERSGTDASRGTPRATLTR